MVTKEEYQAAVAKKAGLEEIINTYHRQLLSDWQSRWAAFERGDQFFKDEDLIYAAGARCNVCRAGLAYPKECGPGHQWDCSRVLKGEVPIKEGNSYHDRLPFAFYSVKSENQPSAYGHTTRPKVSENTTLPKSD